ncbi:ATP synthase-coupling factor 6, mitochondrial isoform X2 [Pan paniscus]|uniref:ATP synthase-coupling factor 6, mitochondrial isoform X2 n=1 Tax=Pan paniscus TaxID=9597 RepID=UPI0024371D8E|nr:ATP synthase-coupling factor 6, mitochondrial isoform X2 [Pan paniscus]
MGVTAPGTSGNKTQRRPRGGPLWGKRPRNEAGPRGPALPSSPAAALTRSGIGPVAPARTPEPAENGSGEGSTCSVSPDPSGRRLSPRRFLSGERRPTETAAHNALRWRNQHDSSEAFQVLLCHSVSRLSPFAEEHWCYSSGI